MLTLFCGAFELALRGHDEKENSENRGIFKELVNFSAELDNELKVHIQSAKLFEGISSDDSDCESSATFEHNGYVEYDPLEIHEKYTGNEELAENEEMAEDTLAGQNNNRINAPEENTIPSINATSTQQTENHYNLALNTQEKRSEEKSDPKVANAYQ
ncbi:unnamed protein product [Acanthoscelides obtectus]|uniref:DUF4371 domain-containing protein n=1 Tax=Acanthoscelides obtectus TaxID=200917 RepID=A0A9P0NXS8_ACAOB|nr:unnamed protein product [Acanthoscelides obtectus]CAK1667312.1 hypothetical protein AOBTE_LOCUS25770 [Acanthoscelides obtectus]